MRKLWVVLAVLALTHIWLLTGCGDDDGDDGDEPQDTDSSLIDDFHCNLEDHYTVDDGNFCHDDFQCKSRFCEARSSVPLDPDATCVAPPKENELRYMATVVDFETNEPIPGVEVGVAPAILTSIQQREVKPTKTATSDENGFFEMTLMEGKDLTDPMAEVAMADHPDYYFTVTGVVEINTDKTWPEGSSTNNMILIKQELVEKIQTAMLNDPNTKNIPKVLGTDGGSMGRMFRLSNGQPIEGAVLKTRLEKGKSIAIILYPNEDITGFQDSTSSNGMFLIFQPGTGEKFDIFKDDKQISTPWDEGTTGTAPTLIFALNMWVDDLEWCDDIPVDIDAGI